jgi:amylosucrase
MAEDTRGRAPVEEVLDCASAELGELEGAAFRARWRVVANDLVEALSAVYGETHEIGSLLADLVGDALAAARARPAPLRTLDRVREVDPEWFLAPEMVGYIAYADRFAGDLKGVAAHVEHLEALDVRYLHLMPLLEPREGENDGGYAVTDYDAVDPRLGDVADLTALADRLHEHGVALCVDLVLNHTAREHEWARRAVEGDPRYQDFYWFFPDRSEPDAYERTLPEVFPDMAPGSFTRLDVSQGVTGPLTGWWVWTTFHEFQWDLRWSNPAVFRAMLGVLFRLANRGVDIVRLDAVPFLWKRLGTNCQNQPEAHRILQALRALVRLAMPGVLLKGEAIVGPDELVGYLGGHDRFRPECDLAYDNQLMVMIWSALASRDVRLTAHSLGRRRTVPGRTTWVTYVRCHDDIGWAVSDENAWALGIDPAAHRRFLASFYAGRFPGSFARGLDFQPEPHTGEARTSGMAASLVGLDDARAAGDEAAITAALHRLETAYAVVYSFGGIPLVYMGDEVGLGNDPRWDEDPAHADDNRWLHRPPMDWARVEERHHSGTVEHRAFSALQRLAAARASTPSLGSNATVEVLDSGNSRVLGYVRRHPRAAPVVCLACFSDTHESVAGEVVRRAGLTGPVNLHSTTGGVDWVGDSVVLGPWQFLWLTDPA